MRLPLFLLALLVSVSSWALNPQDRVDNFRLLDQTGTSHELYYFSDAKAVVLMTQTNDCDLVANSVPTVKTLRDEYTEQGVQFFMINSNLGDDRASIIARAEELGLDIPVLMDPTQIIGESLGVERSGEIFVVDTSDWTVAYHGALGKKGKHLKAALTNVVAGQPVKVASTRTKGCAIDFPEQANRAQHANISYSDTIAPMLLDNCVACHRPGGIGPWEMTEYNMVRGFSLMMREVLRTGRMPPWHADPAYGHFSNDRSLTTDQKRTLVHWIEAGAPRGDGPDPLAEFEHNWPTWSLGEPDLVMDIPPTEVPATGVVDYQYLRVENPLDHDVWVRASEILPGERSILHHTITRFGEIETEGKRRGKFKREGGGGLGGYVPGMVVREYPDDTGTLLPVGTTIEFQMHYTPTGKAAVDESQMGVWFHDEPPKNKIDGMVLINFKFKIPPYAKNHKEFAEQVLKKDAILYSLLPHSHFRGKASQFAVVYPDGTEEMLLSVPNYDFNWQTTYVLTEPKFLPAGTKIIHTTWWDNSAQNPANPDPTREVPWGEQSWDEMLFGAITLRYLDEAEAATYDQVAGSD